jgi:ribonuclease HI
MKTKIYAVVAGRNGPGIYKTWSECSEQVSGYKNSIFKSFSTLNDATNYLKNNNITLDSSKLINIDTNNIDTNITIVKPMYKIPNQILYSDNYDVTKSIYVDGGQNALTLPNAYGCVTNNLGEDLLTSNMNYIDDLNFKEVELPIGKRICIIVNFNDCFQQNNGAELMSAIVGLRIAINSNDTIKYICSDSKLIVDFWSKYLKPETMEKMPLEKSNYVKMLIHLTKTFENIGGKLIKISGDNNPADLGFH